jgi:hypothetical protein
VGVSYPMRPGTGVLLSLNKLEGGAVKGGGVHVLREGGSTIGSDELTSVMEGALVEAENERKGA